MDQFAEYSKKSTEGGRSSGSRWPSDRPAKVGDRLERLCSVASVLADHGWPIVRGTYFEAGAWRGVSGCKCLQPIDKDWESTWTFDVDQVATWWSSVPYSVLVVCGQGVDCLEVPARYTTRMLPALAKAMLFAPAMLTPTGKLALFVQTDHRAAGLVSANLRGLGAWVGIPPSSHHADMGARGYQWVPGLSPDRLGWRLPKLRPVYEVIAATAATGARDIDGAL